MKQNTLLILLATAGIGWFFIARNRAKQLEAAQAQAALDPTNQNYIPAANQITTQPPSEPVRSAVTVQDPEIITMAPHRKVQSTIIYS